MRSIRLESGGGIGMKMFRLVDPESVKRTRANIRNSREIAAVLALKWLERSLRVFIRAVFEDEFDLFCLRRPKPKMSLIFAH